MACADDTDGLNIVKDNYVTTIHHDQPKEDDTTTTRKWTVMAKIGEGGYGSVYKVKNDKGDIYAMKVEKKNKKRDHYKLSMEYHIMKEVQNISRPAGTVSHFTEVLDRGRKEQFCFIVMSLLGESMADLRKKRQPAIFSLGTVYGAAIQTLEAVQEMHSIGYIHRDIKPGNYAIGLEKKRSTIYILDFGIARKILNEKGELKAPRTKVPFKGTIRYAPIACHKQQELGTKDDVESWFYMVIDFGNPDGCNWRGEKNKDRVLEIKEESRTPQGRERLFRGVDQEQLGLILDYIDERNYCDRLDYEYVIRLLKRAARHAKVTTLSPYDWEKNESEKKKASPHSPSAVLSQSDKPVVTQPTIYRSMKAMKNNTNPTKSGLVVNVNAKPSESNETFGSFNRVIPT